MNTVKGIFLFLFCLTLFYSQARAQENMQEMSEEQKSWMEYMTPGWAHEMLAKSAGEWKTTTTFWQAPGSEPMTSEGTSKYEMILGGRYLQSTHSGTAWGMEMEGISLTAYDNTAKEFINTWIDNMGTGIAISKGTYDEETNEIVFIGSMMDPMSKQEMKFKQVIKNVDDNTQIYEMYILDGENEFKTMEMKSTRM